jgi:hypothetical protein
MKFLTVFLFSLGLGWAQTPSCTFKGSFTTATTGVVYKNNTANPNCNAWALTWNIGDPATSITALSIQLEGSDDNSTFAAFTGATTVLVGTNPGLTLSGANVIQASSKLSFVRVKVNSITGSGTINYQVYGYNGVTQAAQGAASGGGTSWSAITAGTNSNGFLQVHSPTVLEPTAISGGGIYATQMVDGNDLPALTISTPGGPAIDFLNVLTTVGGAGATVTARSFGADSNVNLLVSSKGSGSLQLNVAGLSIDPTGAMTAGNGTSIGPTGTGVVNANQVNGAVVPASALVAATNSSRQVIAATLAGTGTSVPMTNGLGANGNCAEWTAAGLGDAGLPCGSGGGGGGGVISYSSSADTLLATQFFPPGGGAPASSTESDVQVASPATATISNLHVQISSALGMGNSAVFTWRDAGSSTTSTCTISGAVAVSCSDTTHSFTAAAGDLLDMQTVTTGVPGPVNVLFTSAFGTSGVGVTSVFGNTGPVVGATGDINATGRVEGINAVPLCSGFTPTNGQNLQYTTGSSPNPCYTAATATGAVSSVGGLTGAVPGGWILQEQHTASGSTELDFTTCISSSYDDYRIDLLGVTVTTNGALLRLQYSTNGGSTYDTTSGNYIWASTAVPMTGTATPGGNNGGATATGFNIWSDGSNVGILNTALPGATASLMLFNPASTSQNKTISANGIHVYSGNSTVYSITGSGFWLNAVNAANAFRFIVSAGTFAGIVRCYGVAKQ